MGWRRVRRVDQEFLPGGDRFSENHLYLSKGLAGRHTSPVITVSRSPPHHALIKISSPKAAASVPLAITRLGPTANVCLANCYFINDIRRLAIAAFAGRYYPRQT